MVVFAIHRHESHSSFKLDFILFPVHLSLSNPHSSFLTKDLHLIPQRANKAAEHEPACVRFMCICKSRGAPASNKDQPLWLHLSFLHLSETALGPFFLSPQKQMLWVFLGYFKIFVKKKNCRIRLMSLEWLFSLEIRMHKERKDKDAKRENLGSKNFLKLQSAQIR